MSKFRSFIEYWLPALVWMAIIFCASGDSLSFQHSSRIIEPFLRWLFPHISYRTLHSAVVAIRKCGHLSEYALLALLLWRAFRKPGTGAGSHWSWRQAGGIALLVLLYAASDEMHQAFVPSREASVTDVLIDTTGAVLALIFLWAIGRWRRRW